MRKEMFVDFFKVYAVFILFPLLINLSMEILIPTAEEKQVTGIIMFFLIFSFFGSLIYLKKNYRWVKMGMLSLLIGFILEFAFMRPEWVLNIYNSNITGDVIGAVLVTSLYWFIAWGIPSFALHRLFSKLKHD
jgi:hypothetical protein